jgi:methyl-accepting chemotaxis protein
MTPFHILMFTIATVFIAFVLTSFYGGEKKLCNADEAARQREIEDRCNYKIETESSSGLYAALIALASIFLICTMIVHPLHTAPVVLAIALAIMLYKYLRLQKKHRQDIENYAELISKLSTDDLDRAISFHKTLLAGKDNDEINALDNALGSYLLALQTRMNRKQAHLYPSSSAYETKTDNTIS